MSVLMWATNSLTSGSTFVSNVSIILNLQYRYFIKNIRVCLWFRCLYISQLYLVLNKFICDKTRYVLLLLYILLYIKPVQLLILNFWTFFSKLMSRLQIVLLHDNSSLAKKKVTNMQYRHKRFCESKVLFNPFYWTRIFTNGY